jgi:hypothetical protein
VPLVPLMLTKRSLPQAPGPKPQDP